MNIQEQLDKADQFIESGDYPAAVNLYNDIINDAPECDEAWLMLGSIYGESGEIEKAIAHIEKAISIKPNDGYAYLALGQVKNSIGDTDAASLAFKKAIECDNENTDALCTLASLYQDQGKVPEAIKLFEKAVALDDSLVNVWAMLGPLHFQENNLATAEECFEKTLSFQSADPYSLLGYCGFLNSIDHTTEVLTLLGAVPDEIKDNPEVLFQLSSAYSSEGLNAKALDCINKAIETDFQEKYILNKANILQTTGDYDEAFEILKPYIETDPPNVTAIIILSKFCKSIDLESECSQLLGRLITDQNLSPYVKDAVQKSLEWLNSQ